MSNFSRTACSLAPAYFHHWRSKSSISASRSESSPEPSGWELSSAELATIWRLLGPGKDIRFGLIIGEGNTTLSFDDGVAHGWRLRGPGARSLAFAHGHHSMGSARPRPDRPLV